MPSGTVIWPGRCFAAASPPRSATTVAITMSMFRLRYISEAHEIVEVDGPVVVDAGHARNAVVLGEVGQGDRLRGLCGIAGEVDAVWRHRLGQPGIRLHVLHVLAGCEPGYGSGPGGRA